jgi:hypothetical protein
LGGGHVDPEDVDAAAGLVERGGGEQPVGEALGVPRELRQVRLLEPLGD